MDEDKIMELFRFCPQCGKKVTKKEPHVVGGSRLVVKWECEDGCNTSWATCPQLHRRAADNNILVSAGIFFTGATYTDISEWAEVINLQIPKETLFYAIQKNYLIPVVHAAYADHNKDIINSLKLKNLEGHKTQLCGDGRSDSPGMLY